MDIGRINAPYAITEIDPWLAPHAGDIELRMNRFKERRYQLVGNAETLADKLAVVREEKIAGAAYWKLELAEDSVWGLLSGFISGGELTVSVSGNSAG